MTNERKTLNLLEELATERPTVTLLNGVDYEMRVPSEFGIDEQVQMLRVSRVIERVVGGEGDVLTDKEREDLSASLDRSIRLILIAPEAEIDRLDDRTKQRLLDFYMSFTTAAKEVTEEAETETGENSSPPSSDSMVATPPAG